MAYYVIDEQENFVSWPEDGDQPESFKTEKAAVKRAKELAKNNPGTTFVIAQDILRVYVPVGEAVTEST